MKLKKHVAMVSLYLGISSKFFTKHINISIIFVHICICMYVYTHINISIIFVHICICMYVYAHKYIHKSHYYECRWLNVTDMQEEMFSLSFSSSRGLEKPNQIREENKIKYYINVEATG